MELRLTMAVVGNIFCRRGVTTWDYILIYMLMVLVWELNTQIPQHDVVFNQE